MVRTTRDGLLKDALDNWTKDAKGNAGPTKANITGTPAKLDDVVYVVGSKWKQRFLVPNPQTGNHQFLDKQWNRANNSWEPYGQKNDWETQCSTCHATGYRVLSVRRQELDPEGVDEREEHRLRSRATGRARRHASSRKKADIFNPRNATKAEADKVCGYCHIRGENELWHTAQGNPSEHLPHPIAGETYKAGQDDWTKWYTDKFLLPGRARRRPDQQELPEDRPQQRVQHRRRRAEERLLRGAQAPPAVPGAPAVEAREGRTARAASTATRRTARRRRKSPPAAGCTGCHGASMDPKKMMPGLAQTAGGLMMRSHAFNPNPRAAARHDGRPAAAAGVRLPEVVASAMPVAPAATGPLLDGRPWGRPFCLPFPHKRSPDAGTSEISRVPSTAT